MSCDAGLAMFPCLGHTLVRSFVVVVFAVKPYPFALPSNDAADAMIQFTRPTMIRVALKRTVRFCSSAIPPPKLGYQSMGSFHSEDVEAMLRMDESSYVPPASPLPPSFLEKQEQCITDAANLPLGREFGKQHFLLDQQTRIILEFK